MPDKVNPRTWGVFKLRGNAKILARQAGERCSIETPSGMTMFLRHDWIVELPNGTIIKVADKDFVNTFEAEITEPDCSALEAEEEGIAGTAIDTDSADKKGKKGKRLHSGARQ